MASGRLCSKVPPKGSAEGAALCQGVRGMCPPFLISSGGARLRRGASGDWVGKRPTPEVAMMKRLLGQSPSGRSVRSYAKLDAMALLRV